MSGRRFMSLGLMLLSMVSLGAGQSAPPLQRAGLAMLPAESPDTPLVNAPAFHHLGRLAFVWDNHLYILDGNTGELHQIVTTGIPAYPAWPPDGRWLAYIEWPWVARLSGDLWFVRADGSDAHKVSGLPSQVWSLSWSPTSDVLAASLGPQSYHNPERESVGCPAWPGGLWLVSPMGHPHKVAGPTGTVTSVSWSPSGTSLAYSVDPLPRVIDGLIPACNASALPVYTVSVRGGHPTPYTVGPAAQASNSWSVLGWWPDGRGLVVVHTVSKGLAVAYAVPVTILLVTLPFGGTPRSLGYTQEYEGWAPPSVSGRDLLFVSGMLPEAWMDKELVSCDVETARCRTLPRRPKTVALDPAWSSRGNQIAYVEAPYLDVPTAIGYAAFTQAEAWLQERRLWVTNRDGSQARPLSDAGSAIFTPQWSRHGDTVLYVRDFALWLIHASGGPPTELVGRFSAATPLYINLDGWADWSMFVAWYRL